ncbi:MAG: recombinase XerC, partial [Clostridia bacterium]|nr:recombinase XerC [Clostridia bacterium]
MYDYSDAPQEIKNFITYMVTIRGRSKLTANEYFLDLRNFFRFILYKRNLVPKDIDFKNISIISVDL